MNSPAEYVEELRASVRLLRAELIRARQEKLEALTRIAEMQRKLHPVHDWEPARPGVSDID